VKLDTTTDGRAGGTFGGLAFGEQIIESILEVVNLGLRFVAIEGRESIVDTTSIREFALCGEDGGLGSDGGPAEPSEYLSGISHHPTWGLEGLGVGSDVEQGFLLCWVHEPEVDSFGLEAVVDPT